MQRPTLFKYHWLAILLGVFLASWCGAACSAPLVQRESRPISRDPYPAAAAALGFAEWGDTTRNEQVVHVTARLDSERVRWLIVLPSTTSVDTAESWLEELAAAMGWQEVDLRSNMQPDGLFLRADVRKSVRQPRFGASEVRLEVKTLTAELRKLTPKPVLLGIRVVGAELQSASVPAVASGPAQGHHFLFYRLGGTAPVSGPLTLTYGIPQRWLAAGAVGFILWLLFPVVALFAVRGYLLTQSEVEARQRLAQYRRWQRGVLVVPTLLVVGALILSRFSLVSYFGTAFAFAVPLVIVLPSTAFALMARLIGMPLERAAWPQRADLPWYRLAGMELGISALILVMVVGTSTSMSAVMRPGSGGPGSTRFFVLPMLLPLLVGVGALVWGAITSQRRKNGTLSNETEAPEDLRVAVEELTTRLGCPVDRVRIITQRGGTMAGHMTVQGSLAVVGREVSESLAPDQVAALIAAAALAQPRTPADRWLTWGLSAGMMLPALALLGWMTWNSGGSSANRPPLALMVLLAPLTMITSMVAQRRNQKRQEAADLQAAEASSDSRRFLDALRQLEELQLAAGGLDPTTARTAVIYQRRTRLERRLGLE